MAPKKRHLYGPDHAEPEPEPAQPTTSVSIPLPNEIVSLIADSVQDLIPLTLVSRQWYHAAQSRLHWQIRVSSGASCKHWSRKFNKFPHLASFVRVLELSDPDDDCLESPYLRSQPAKRLAAALTGVTRLEIVDFVRWGPVEQRLIKSFCNLECLSVGRIPCMSRSKDLPDLVFSFSKLSGLMIYGDIGMEYDPEEGASVIEAGKSMCRQFPLDGKPVQLTEVLSLSTADACHDLLMWFSSPGFDLSKLQLLAMKWSELPFGMPSPVISALDNICTRISGSLTVLDLGFPDDPTDVLSSHLIDSKILSQFTALIEIRLDHSELERNLPSALGVTVPLLKSLSAPCLRVIEFKAGAGVTKRDDQEYLELAEWKLLDELLVDGTFPSVRSFRFLLYVIQKRCYRGPLVRCTAETYWLPKASSKGILDLEIMCNLTWEECRFETPVCEDYITFFSG
ncbi:hypothetical protein E1B28_003897 [Marasmius oreades]|uniref:F-box domain-containing protein n=1 Tax=Marasmius oreades TaxID=181124 RepID=A0A9P8ABU1_9AGAR|nr:uncharacterized protein E1B28_003897 [Marasmius oreades]KAG7096464.1 hypothetical protein E1B28_003897 [Marasmius oreades]